MENLSQREPLEIARLLQELITSSADPGHSTSQVHLDLVRYQEILNGLGYETIASVYQSAAEASFREVLWLLRSDRIRAGEREEVPEGFAAQLGSLTLGLRKALSRSPKRARIELLLFDADPMVIRELLLNPKITEREVVRIAARHHAPVEVLKEVLFSDRWMVNYRVRKALAFNPATPKSYLPGLIRHLCVQDLRLWLQSGAHDEEIRRIVRGRQKKP
ncbi:MAG: hypothetical protein V1798_03790 [Pseudomonadota bacterium]